MKFIKTLIWTLTISANFFIVQMMHATWDVTTPAGTEAKNLGDDRIREFKVDIQASLRHEGDFPGSDTSNPRFIYTPSTGTTAQRPTSSTNTAVGMIYVNVTSGTIEQYYGGGVWRVIATTIPFSGSINSTHISTEIAGAGLDGGGGVPLRVNVDSTTFSIVNDTITIKTGGVTSTLILDGTVASADIAIGTITIPGAFKVTLQPRFSAYNSLTDTDVSGNGVTTTVDFNTEEFDTANNFSADTFTAPITGFYQLNVGITLKDAGGQNCEVHIVTSDFTFSSDQGTVEAKLWMPMSWFTQMDSGDTARVDVYCSGGAQIIDVIGNNGTASGVGIPTFFSGYLAN